MCSYLAWPAFLVRSCHHKDSSADFGMRRTGAGACSGWFSNMCENAGWAGMGSGGEHHLDPPTVLYRTKTHWQES